MKMINSVPHVSPTSRDLPVGFRILPDRRLAIVAGGEVVMGGSPWRISRLGHEALAEMARLRRSRDEGLQSLTTRQALIHRLFLDRGFAIPLPESSSEDIGNCPVIIPAMDRVEMLSDCLTSLRGADCVVVDDCSVDSAALGGVASGLGARVLVHSHNKGPAAARNTGMNAVDTEFVAFVDSDCEVGDRWLQSLLGHFRDPAVGMVAPRIVADSRVGNAIGSYERMRSALDMGTTPELVTPGGRMSYVPSAALVARREALGGGFDETMRVGEDVDLVWRMVDAGWQVRYDPIVIVHHRVRASLADFIGRRFAYGTSAPGLASRHPGTLRPAHVSLLNVACLALVLAGRPRAGLLVAAAHGSSLAWNYRSLPSAPAVTGRLLIQSMDSDVIGVGSLLRREWWPVGAIAIALAPRSKVALAASATMLGPVVAEAIKHRRDLKPLPAIGLRLLDDAAYGSGVLVSCVKARHFGALLPKVSLPFPLASLGRLRRRTSAQNSQRSC